MADIIEICYPTAEELSTINKNLTCPLCSTVFKSDSNLSLHLFKTHKKQDIRSNNIQKQYHCPIITCNYHKSDHFKKLKSLKQHFLKVHSEKKFICNSCQKGFATEAFRNWHFQYCNVSFKCCDCNMNYPCYETLKTHSRRKNHKILDKRDYKSISSGIESGIKYTKSDMSVYTKNRPILPKVSKSTGTIITMTEQSSQTEPKSATLSTSQTQTLVSRMPYLTVETQTIGDYFTRKPEMVANPKNTKTQTKTSDPKTVSCNTSFNLDDLELIGGEIQRNSSSTQTTCNSPDFFYSSSTSTHDSIHTDTSDLLSEAFDSNFFNCHMETQTDNSFSDDLLSYCDYYSNMYTQTCQDLLLGEIGLNNTHTQTVFDDVLKSVESQTVMSQSRKIPLSCKDMNHMETQTEAEFKRRLEEINA